MSKILERLYLGSYVEAKNQVELKKKGITHIVTVGSELQVLYPGSFKYLYIPAFDLADYDLSPYFDQVAEFIHKAIEEEKSSILVHCLYGISRSVTCVIAYLIKYHQMTSEKAYKFVKSKRSVMNPNDGFLKQLSIYCNKMDSSEEIEEEQKINKELVNKLEYCCKECEEILFDGENVVHNKDLSGTCLDVYLKYMSWMGQLKNNSNKIICPNSKCGMVIGFIKREGGKCCCGVHVDKMFALYPKTIVLKKTQKKD